MKSFLTHLWDIMKAAAAVALIQAISSFVAYLGAHLPPTAELAASLGGGFAAIKAKMICRV